jgi:hypothetical protein
MAIIKASCGSDVIRLCRRVCQKRNELTPSMSLVSFRWPCWSDLILRILQRCLHWIDYKETSLSCTAYAAREDVPIRVSEGKKLRSMTSCLWDLEKYSFTDLDHRHLERKDFSPAGPKADLFFFAELSISRRSLVWPSTFGCRLCSV